MAKALAITIPKYDLCAPWPDPKRDYPELEEMEDLPVGEYMEDITE